MTTTDLQYYATLAASLLVLPVFAGLLSLRLDRLDRLARRAAIRRRRPA